MSFQLNWNGEQAKARAKQAEQEGLRKAGEFVRGESQQRAPVDEGTLRASATLKDVDADTVSVGFYTPYAAKQHEEVGYRHPKGGQAKYLESVLTEEQPTIKALIAASVRRAFQ
jgi:hypothetical protein